MPGRFESVDAGQPFHVIVDYAHKPDALEKVLRAARELAGGKRVICVVGAGGDRDRGKRPVMGRLASELADVAIVTSDNPRSEDPEAIAAEIVAGADGRGRGRARPGRGDRARDRAGAARRRRRHRRQGRRAGPGVRRPDGAVRRSRGREGGFESVGGPDLIPLPLAEVRALSLGRLEGDADDGHRRRGRLAPDPAGRPVRRGLAAARRSSTTRARAAPRRRSCPDDAHAALAALGSAVRARSDARVVAITGSVGKTSTKDILAALLRPRLRTVAAPRRLQQRDRPAAHALPDRARDGGRRDRDGDARPRPDPRPRPRSRGRSSA